MNKENMLDVITIKENHLDSLLSETLYSESKFYRKDKKSFSFNVDAIKVDKKDCAKKRFPF